ncbi:MAG: sulfatase-like hydrolase/transferase, partial [Ferruginibacter sp.]
MNTINSFFKIAVSFVILLLITFSVSITAQNNKRPNIIYMMSDDHGYQAISAYGYGLNHTPNIDQLANQGMLFTRAFVTNSI